MGRKTNGQRQVSIKKCKFCGKEFISTANRTMYCSIKCSNAWKSLFGYHYKPAFPVSDTKCWDCKRATGGSFCPWANWFIPVEGWVATPTNVKMGGNKSQKSYVVHECPIFDRG